MHPIPERAIEPWQLQQRQGLPLRIKIKLTERRIAAWMNEWGDDKVCVNFSGGKDSTVLLHIARSINPTIPAVFVNTGLEYPEILTFVRQFDNLITLKPRKKFKEVLTSYGYPVISKVVAKGISRVRTAKDQLQRDLRMFGGVNPTSGKMQAADIPKKYHYLIDAPFPISDQCCHYIKKEPLLRYQKATGMKPMIATMAGDSSARKKRYLKEGCNVTGAIHPVSQPMAFWLERDIWEYIETFNLPISKIYAMGESNTGCMFCMFGVHLDSKKGLNRFQRMKHSHPKHYAYCIDRLGCGKVLDYINVPY